MPIPKGVAETGARRADIGVAVVTIYIPGLQYAVHIAFMARPAHVVGDLVVAAFLEGFPHAAGDVLQGFFPTNAFPFAVAAFAGSFQRVQDAIRIIDLVNGGRPFGAVAPPAARMVRVAFKLADLPGILIDKGSQAAGGFAVETGSRNNGIVALVYPRPGFGLVFYPVVPFFRRREIR